MSGMTVFVRTFSSIGHMSVVIVENTKVIFPVADSKNDSCQAYMVILSRW